MSTPIRIKRSAVPGKIPTTGDLQLGELAINTYDGRAFLKKDNGTESIVSVGGGYPGSTYFVAENGLDTNDGEDESTAFATIAKALTVVTSGDTIEIASGTFTEVFPLTVPQGVTVRGKGLRSTTVQPTSGTERNDAFLLNGECAVQELSVTNFYYDSSADTGYAFKFAPGMVTTNRSPYVQRVTVLTKGSDTSASDPYGFDTADNYPTSKVAGRGCLIDGSVVSSATLEPAILFNECTFITPNQTGLKMTNGARAEWVNCFTYFASVSIDGSSGSVGVGSTANATLKLSGATTTITQDQVIKYYQGGPAVAIGTVTSVDGAYVTISGKGDGIFNAVGIGSTQDVRIFASDGVTQVGTASTILWADYQKFGADLRAIGAASNFGTLGVRGDGAGVQLRLFGYNFGCVGSGKTFTQDPTLTIRSNEAIQLNGGRVFFQSVDQEGNFRVGNIFEISQETGAVSLASTSDINIAGTATIQDLNVVGFATFQGQILHQDPNFITDETTYNLINTNAGAVNFAGAGTSIVIGATTGITTIRNYEVNLSGGQESYTSTTGTLTVDGGVGISSNLNVGKDLKVTGVSTFVSAVSLDNELKVSGVSTFVSDVEANSNLRVTGVSTFTDAVRLDDKLNVAGITTFNTDVTFDTNIGVTGVSTFTGDVMLSGDLRVAGVSTFVDAVRIEDKLNVTGISTFTGDVRLDNNIRVAGVSTFVGDTTLDNNLAVTGVSTMTGSLMVADDLRVAGVSTFVDDVMLGSDLNVAGITTTATLRVTGISTLMGDVRLDQNLRVAGVSTFVGDTRLDQNLRVAGVSTLVGDVELSNNLQVTGLTTFVGVTTYQNDLYVGNDLFVLGDTRIVGVLTVGSSSITLDGSENQINIGTGVTAHTDRVTVTQFRASGVSTFGSSVDIESDFTVAGISTFTGTVNYDAAIGTSFTNTGTANLNNVNVTGILTAPFINSDTGADFAQMRVTGVSTLADFTISSGIITGPSQIVIDPAGVDDNTGSVRIRGDLYVDGTQTTINSTVVEVGDKLVGLGTTAIEIVQEVTGVNYTNGGVTITGVNTTGLAIGYGASSNNVISAASSIVSIGASFVVLSVAPTDNSEVILGIGITAVLVGSGNTSLTGIDTSNPNIVVGAALSSVNTIDSQEGTFVGINTNVISGLNTSTILIDDRVSGTYIPSNTATGFGVTVVAIGNSTITIDQPSQTPVDAQEVGTLTGINTNIIGINTISLSSGVTVFGPYIPGGTTVASIASSEGVGATYPNGFITLSQNSTSPAGVTTDTYFFASVGVATTSIVITRSSLSYQTRITEIGVGTIYFTPSSVEKVGVATVAETVTVRNNGTILFVSNLTGDVLSDGGGLLLYGKTNKTLTWSDSTDSWTSSEHFDVVSGKSYKHGGTTFYDGSQLTVANANITSGVATDFTIVSGNVQNTIATRITTNDINVATAVTARDVLPEHIQVSAATTTYRLTVNTDTIGQNIDISGIITANSGFVTTLQGTDITYTGIASFGTIKGSNVQFEYLENLTVVGLTTVDQFISTSVYVTGVSSVATQNVYSGFSTSHQITSLQVTNGGPRIEEIEIRNATFSGISTTTITGIHTDNIDIGTILSGTYVSAGTTVVSIGASTLGISTVSITPYSSNGELVGLNTSFIVGVDTGIVVNGNTIGVGETDPAIFVGGPYVSAGSTIIGIGETYFELSLPTINPAGVTTDRFYFATTEPFNGTVGYAATVTPLGIATISYLVNTDSLVGTSTITTAGISSLTIDVGFATEFSTSTLNFNAGVGTELTVLSGVFTDIYSSGITSIGTLNVATGFATNFIASDVTINGIATVREFDSLYSVGLSTISYLTGENTNFSGINTFFIGIGSHITVEDFTSTGVGTFASLYTTDFSASGLSTITHVEGDSFNFTGLSTATNFISSDVRVSGAASISTLRADVGIVTNLEWTDGYSSGITSLGTLNVNSGVITSLNAESLDIGFIIGTNFYISGIGSANEFNINVGTSTHFTTNDFEATGFSTVVSFKATDAEVTGVTTISTLLISPNNELSYISAGTNLDFQGIGTVINLYTNVGVITHLSGTDVEYTGISTLTSIQSVDLRTTGVATITQIEGTSANITGICTFGDVFATTIKTDALDLTGAAINFTGIATFRILNTDDATIGSARAANLEVTGISTLPRIYNTDIQSTGFTTTYNGIHVGAGGTIITADATSGIGSVGINTAIPRNALHVYGNIQQDGSTLVGTISTERSTGTAVKVHTELGRFDYRSVEYTIQVSYGVTHQVAKIMSVHDGVTAYNSEYANISTGIDIATFDVQIDNTVPPGNIALVVTPTYGASGITTIVANFQATRLTSL